MLGCRRSSRNVSRMCPGIGPRLSIRFTTGVGHIRPHRCRPTEPPLLSLTMSLTVAPSSDPSSSLRSKSIASVGSTTGTTSRLSIVSGPPARCRGRSSCAPSPAGPTPGAVRRSSRCSARRPPFRRRLTGRRHAAVFVAATAVRLIGRPGGCLDLHPRLLVLGDAGREDQRHAPPLGTGTRVQRRSLVFVPQSQPPARKVSSEMAGGQSALRVPSKGLSRVVQAGFTPPAVRSRLRWIAASRPG